MSLRSCSGSSLPRVWAWVETEIVSRCAGDPCTVALSRVQRLLDLALLAFILQALSQAVSQFASETRGEKINKKLKQRAAFVPTCAPALRAPTAAGQNKAGCHHRSSIASTPRFRLVNKLRSLAPATAIAQELVRFDAELIETPEISGVEYQQGTLAGDEVREYLFEKWGRTCVCCDAVNVPLNLDPLIS